MNPIDNKQAVQRPLSRRIAYLDGMRAIAIIMVVGAHSIAYSQQLPQETLKLAYFIVNTISVPTFYFIDGYLLGSKVLGTGTFNYRQYVKNSAYRLLVPWAIFSCVYIMARYIAEMHGIMNKQIIVTEEHWKDLLISIYGSVYTSHLYFLLSLFIIRLFSPMVQKLIFNKRYSVSVLGFVFYCAAYRLLIPFIEPYLKIEGGNGPILNALFGMQFYIFGAVVFITTQLFNIRKMFMPSVLVTIMLFAIDILYYDFDLSILARLLLLFTVLLFFMSLKETPPLLRSLGEQTMGVYIIHQPVIMMLASRIVRAYIQDPLLSLLSIILLVLLASLGTVRAINSIPFGYVALGGRKP